MTVGESRVPLPSMASRGEEGRKVTTKCPTES